MMSLTVAEFSVFGVAFRRLLSEAGTLFIAQRCSLTALQPALLLRLPARRTAVVAAQGVGVVLRVLALRASLGPQAILKGVVICLLRVRLYPVVAPVVIALSDLP